MSDTADGKPRRPSRRKPAVTITLGLHFSRWINRRMEERHQDRSEVLEHLVAAEMDRETGARPPAAAGDARAVHVAELVDVIRQAVRELKLTTGRDPHHLAKLVEIDTAAAAVRRVVRA